MENHKAIAGIILGITVAFGFSTALADTVDITANVNGAPSPAQKVYIYFSNTPPLGTPPLPNINGLQGYAGQINWNDASDNGGVDTGSPGNLLQYLPASFYDSTHSFSTYCIDITEDILINHSYTFDGLTTDLASTPVIAGTSFTMGASAATAIQNLYDNAFSSVSTNDQAAAFQIAIWDIIYGINSNHASIDVTSNTNRFYVSGASSGVVSMADSLVQAAYAGGSSPHLNILALTNAGVQDQLVVGTPIPTPAAVEAGLVLLGGLAMARKARQIR